MLGKQHHRIVADASNAMQHKPKTCNQKATTGDKLTIHYTVLSILLSTFPPTCCCQDVRPKHGQAM